MLKIITEAICLCHSSPSVHPKLYSALPRRFRPDILVGGAKGEGSF